jgi:hypothetical protein
MAANGDWGKIRLIDELVPKPGWFRNKLSEKPVKARFFH